MHRLYQLKKVQKLLLATNNPGKFRELKEILPKKIKYFKPKDFRLREPVENGKTFKSNAKIKSLYANKYLNSNFINKRFILNILENEKERNHDLFLQGIARYRMFDKIRNTNLAEVYPEFEKYCHLTDDKKLWSY